MVAFSTASELQALEHRGNSPKINSGQAAYEIGCVLGRSLGLPLCRELKVFKAIDQAKLTEEHRREFQQLVLDEITARERDHGTFKECPETRPLCSARFTDSDLKALRGDSPPK